jgi:hypothetical protein
MSIHLNSLNRAPRFAGFTHTFGSPSACRAQLSAATSDVLRHVDWASCCAAGGLVEACLRPAPIEATTP